MLRETKGFGDFFIIHNMNHASWISPSTAG